MMGLGGELLCRLWKSEILLWTGLTCSTYNLLAVSVERFLEVISTYYLCQWRKPRDRNLTFDKLKRRFWYVDIDLMHFIRLSMLQCLSNKYRHVLSWGKLGYGPIAMGLMTVLINYVWRKSYFCPVTQDLNGSTTVPWLMVVRDPWVAEG